MTSPRTRLREPVLLRRGRDEDDGRVVAEDPVQPVIDRQAARLVRLAPRLLHQPVGLRVPVELAVQSRAAATARSASTDTGSGFGSDADQASDAASKSPASTRSVNAAHSSGRTWARMPDFARAPRRTSRRSAARRSCPSRRGARTRTRGPPRSRVPSPFVSFQPAASRSAAAAGRVERQRSDRCRRSAGESGAQGPEMIRADPLKSSRTIAAAVEQHRHRPADARVREERRAVVQRDVVPAEVVELDERGSTPRTRRRPRRALSERRVEPRLVEVAGDERPVRDGIVRKDPEDDPVEVRRGHPHARGLRSRTISRWRLPGDEPVRTVGERGAVVRRRQEASARRSAAPAGAAARTPSRGTRTARGTARRTSGSSAASTDTSPSNTDLKTGDGTFGIDDPPDREDRVGGRHRRPVLPDGVRADRERVGPAVRRDGPALGQPGTSRMRESKSRRLRETYWRTSCSGRSGLQHGVQRRGIADEAAAEGPPLPRAARATIRRGTRAAPGAAGTGGRARRRTEGRRAAGGPDAVFSRHRGEQSRTARQSAARNVPRADPSRRRL